MTLNEISSTEQNIKPCYVTDMNLNSQLQIYASQLTGVIEKTTIYEKSNATNTIANDPANTGLVKINKHTTQDNNTMYCINK